MKNIPNEKSPNEIHTMNRHKTQEDAVIAPQTQAKDVPY